MMPSMQKGTPWKMSIMHRSAVSKNSQFKNLSPCEKNMNNRNSKIICTVSFVGAFFALIACGDSKTTETIVEKGATDIVASVADLPKCTAQNEGERMWHCGLFVFHQFTKEITL